MAPPAQAGEVPSCTTFTASGTRQAPRFTPRLSLRLVPGEKSVQTPGVVEK
jgi:hypothetical protein